MLPDRNTSWAYWIVEHEDTCGLGRIRAMRDFIAQTVEADSSIFSGRVSITT